MKKLLLMLAAILVVGGAMTSCTENKKTEIVEEVLPKADFSKLSEHPWEVAIYQYLADSIGIHYGQGEEGLSTICLPAITEVGVDETDSSDIKMWGDFWVYNYQLVNDSLKFVSGGDHPGLIHLSKNGEEYVVTAFDQVGDGSQFMPTAKKIFGDKFPAFQKLNSDVNVMKQQKNKVIKMYVQENKLKVKGVE